MYTSYFKQYKKLLDNGYTNLVSIAGISDYSFKQELLNGNSYLKEYKKLAPKYIWWKKWHTEKLSNEWYINQYYNTILFQLNPHQVFYELGENAILLCYELPDEFCHRHLVANWLNINLNINITELNI